MFPPLAAATTNSKTLADLAMILQKLHHAAPTLTRKLEPTHNDLVCFNFLIKTLNCFNWIKYEMRCALVLSDEQLRMEWKDRQQVYGHWQLLNPLKYTGNSI